MRFLTRYRVTVAVLVVVLAAVVFLNDLGHFNTDIKPEVYLAPWETLGRYLSSWTGSPHLGSPNFNVGLAPVLLLLSALRWIGLSPEMAFKTFHLVLWIVGAAGTSRFVRTIAPRAGVWGGLIAAVVFLANPYTVQAGATLAVALPMVLLPWMLWCLVRALRTPRGWAWPAAFGVTFAAMSGMNVAVVPLFQLLAVFPVAYAVRAQVGVSWRNIGAVLLKCALFVVGLSLYWLVPAMAARSTGSQIAEASETLTGIAMVSSMPEVLRGVGLWPLYGHDASGPWVPEHAVYLLSPMVMVLGILLPVLALVLLRWCPRSVRYGVVGSVGIAALVMVGIFPSEADPNSPFGEVLRTALQQPALVAFRTTNKIGAVLILAFSVAIGVGAVGVWRRHGNRVELRMAVPGVVMLLVIGWILPPLLGGLYTSRMDIPTYWESAAADADQGSPDSTALLLPGQVRPEYRWTVERPDDLSNALMTRDAVLPGTTPNASAPGANFLSALDSQVQSGLAPDEFVSTMSRYLGSDKVILRHDLAWERNGGARPATTHHLLSKDDGLAEPRSFGWPGEFVLSPDGSSPSYDENELSPVEIYDLKRPRQAVRAQSTFGQVLVAGDGFAFAPMTEAGLLKGTPLVRYSHLTSPRDLTRSLPAAGHLVITDTNARRDVIPNRLTAGHGPLLAKDEPLRQTRTLAERPNDQTVLRRSGVVAQATSSGGTFFDLPFGVPEFAVDGDPDTGWRFGDFGRAPGEKLTLTLPRKVRIDEVPISQLSTGVAKIKSVTVTAGGKSDTISLPDSGAARASLGGVVTDKVEVRVDSVRGAGFNHVGIAEVGLPENLTAVRTARTPTTFSDRYQDMGASERKAFADIPLDVLLTRVQNTPSRGDDSETELRREVHLPDRRTFKPTASVRVNGSVESMLDGIAGYDRSVRAISSDHYFRLQGTRASQAADGRPSTAWTPANPIRGEWWQLTTGRRAIPSVNVTQRPAAETRAAAAAKATRVEIAVDGKRVASRSVGWGTTKIKLPHGTRGSTVRMTVVGADRVEESTPPRFTEIDTGAQMKRDSENSRSACRTVAQVDGKPLSMRPASKSVADAAAAGTPWALCGDPLTLGPGGHSITPVEGYILDDLALRDIQREPGVGLTPRFEVTKNTPTAKSLDVKTANGPYAITIGQSVDPRWKATAGGVDLGPARVLDGYSAGWILPDGKARTIEIRFQPQSRATIALAVSGLVLVAALVLIGRRLPRLFRPSAHRQPCPRGPRRPVGRMGLGAAVALAAGSYLALGLAGGLGALAVIAVVARYRPKGPGLLYAGAGLIFVSMPVYLVLLGDERGEVSADVVAQSMWPHWIASAGLVMALVGAVTVRDLPLKRPPRPTPASEDDGAAVESADTPQQEGTPHS
ncbi:alpha-(1-_3)-arabinofuranosyltransferase domain-containing protein [Demetria terragena]|uniref:alpha-(1->3)-arabinofuranosyltransferase domain-containing protein n=1 Tax=Demetria terragena TaxID=63959 RepID=UPI000370172F|nr:alpha-(1->3)-arabinofuranosyltransferase family protein [Demetria terragena]